MRKTGIWLVKRRSKAFAGDRATVFSYEKHSSSSSHTLQQRRQAEV